jgi:hypothetical protein
MKRYADNEVIGAAMAVEAMRQQGGYTDGEMTEIERMILSTKLVEGLEDSLRVQQTHLSGYLLDADLGSFGRDDFLEKCELLIEETNSDAQAFYRLSLQMMNKHTWITNAASLLRSDKKQENLRTLQNKLASF